MRTMKINEHMFNNENAWSQRDTYQVGKRTVMTKRVIMLQVATIMIIMIAIHDIISYYIVILMI